MICNFLVTIEDRKTSVGIFIRSELLSVDFGVPASSHDPLRVSVSIKSSTVQLVGGRSSPASLLQINDDLVASGVIGDLHFTVIVDSRVSNHDTNNTGVDLLPTVQLLFDLVALGVNNTVVWSHDTEHLTQVLKVERSTLESGINGIFTIFFLGSQYSKVSPSNGLNGLAILLMVDEYSVAAKVATYTKRKVESSRVAAKFNKSQYSMSSANLCNKEVHSLKETGKVILVMSLPIIDFKIPQRPTFGSLSSSIPNFFLGGFS